MADLMSKKSFIDPNLSIRVESIPDLTEGQKACLRLVVQHHTSKEIARMLGISPFTVDQRLDAARRKLNASGRKDAAKMFALYESQAISQPLVYETLALEVVQFPVSNDPAKGRVRRRLAKIFSPASLPPTGGERHELFGNEILFHALNIAFLSSVVMAVVVVVLTGAFRLF